MIEDNGFKAKCVLASVGPNGIPIYSIEARYPRFIHSELLTHRDRARNSASSRAIPWKRFKKGVAVSIIQEEFNQGIISDQEFVENLIPNCMYSMIMRDPVVPISFGVEQKGMQSGDELTGDDREKAIKIWLAARDSAVIYAEQLAQLNVHKSICNRIVEPWMFITVLITATEWNNFFRLRCHPAAEKHFQKIAGMIRQVKNEAVPHSLGEGQWHLPYITKMEDPPEYWCGQEGIEIMNAVHDGRIPITDQERDGLSWGTIQTYRHKLISAGRCARLSYLTHEGTRDWNDDIRLAKTLIERTDDVLHSSPLEHVNQASKDKNLRSGPMRGWFQFRKEYALENVEG